VEAESNRPKFKTKGFWLGKYTVTQVEWQAVMGDNPSYFNGTKDNKAKGLNTDRFPVEYVSWQDCRKFLEKINNRNGIAKAFGKDGKFVLPHEDQWEYACRGGKGNKQPYFWGDKLNGTEANCNGNNPFGTSTNGQNLDRPCAVDFTNEGKYEKHAWGLCHMSGNVFQWCDNAFEDTKDRLVRGGYWTSYARHCRSAARTWYAPDYKRSNIGFRVCLTLD
jgi:formylglycine-generating enzyme required for sulfatase activity